MPTSARWDTIGRYVLGLIGLLALAECVTRLELVPAIYLPHASTIMVRVWFLLQDRSFLENLLATLYVWAFALAVSTFISVPLAIALGSSDIAFRIACPIIDLIRPIPSVCLIPLAVIVWGQGLFTKIFLVTYAMTWPILYNGIYGVHDVDPVTIQSARCFGLRRAAVLRHVSLPSAAPFMFTGFRVAATVGLIVLIGVELLTGLDKGIGAFILHNSVTGGQAESVFAAAAIAGFLGLAINLGLEAVDRRAFLWSRVDRYE